MIYSALFLLLSAGLPYYLLLEKSKRFSAKMIFLLSAVMLVGAIVLSLYVPNEHLTAFVLLSYISAIFTIYKATKTTNFYKLGYYLIFINAPFLISTTSMFPPSITKN
jgi:predicted membrane protein